MMADSPEQQLTSEIIGAAIEVHRELGPGLLESAYHQCLAHELTLRSVSFESELAVPVVYKGLPIDCAYRIDFYVAGRVIVELKSVTSLTPIHQAQLMTYLKLLKCKVGLLINFNVPVLKQGIKRVVL